MTDGIWVAIIAVVGVLSTSAGALGGSALTARAQRKSAEVTAKAAIKTSGDSAQDKFIDQLQEELTRYRDENDKRVEKLESRVDELTDENRGYRAFIGVQRDHMAEHGIPLPPWPPHLPR